MANTRNLGYSVSGIAQENHIERPQWSRHAFNNNSLPVEKSSYRKGML